MGPLLIAVGAGVVFIVAYHTYGRWLGSKIFRLSADAVCPSRRLADGSDYVPTPKAIVFGHHFTSIAGTGPIVGPAIAVMWGWLPALLWVVFGSIFIGAVHDFGALVVSLRNNGQTVGDVAGRVLNRRVRLLFLFVLFMALTIVLAIFGLVIAAVFKQYPSAIFPCVVQIPIAVGIGLWLHRKGVGLLIPSLIALGVMYVSVIYGDQGWLHVINETMAGWSIITWVVVLLLYSYVASVLPVWTLLQPRDYINSLQLISALGLIVGGLVWAVFFGGAPPVEGASRPPLKLAAPVWDFDPAGAPMMFPFLFITIACGAISGFHCLVSSGTSSKQLMNEPDARFVGYGSMVTEGFLATLVILACAAGIGLGLPLKMQAVSSPHQAVDYGEFQGTNGEDLVLVTSSRELANVDFYSIRADPRLVLPKDPGLDDGVGFVMPSKEFWDEWILFFHVLGEEGLPPALIKRLEEPSSALPMSFDWVTGMRGGADEGWVFRDWNEEDRSFDDQGRDIPAFRGAALLGPVAWHNRYQSWSSAGGLGAKVGAFVDGSANFLKAIGVPGGRAIALMGVLVASFAGTTLDTACRLQRYVVQELAATFAPRVSPTACAACGYDLSFNVSGACPECGKPADESHHEQQKKILSGGFVTTANPLTWLTNKHAATVFAIVVAAVIAAMPLPGQSWSLANAGKGGMILWPMFGATNQLLGGLSFLVIAFYLWRRSKPVWFLIVPMLFMLIMPLWAMTWQLFTGMSRGGKGWLAEGNWTLVTIAVATLVLEIWMIIEAAMLVPKVKGVLEQTADSCSADLKSA